MAVSLREEVEEKLYKLFNIFAFPDYLWELLMREDSFRGYADQWNTETDAEKRKKIVSNLVRDAYFAHLSADQTQVPREQVRADRRHYKKRTAQTFYREVFFFVRREARGGDYFTSEELLSGRLLPLRGMVKPRRRQGRVMGVRSRFSWAKACEKWNSAHPDCPKSVAQLQDAYYDAERAGYEQEYLAEYRSRTEPSLLVTLAVLNDMDWRKVAAAYKKETGNRTTAKACRERFHVALRDPATVRHGLWVYDWEFSRLRFERIYWTVLAVSAVATDVLQGKPRPSEYEDLSTEDFAFLSALRDDRGRWLHESADRVWRILQEAYDTSPPQPLTISADYAWELAEREGYEIVAQRPGGYITREFRVRPPAKS